MSRRIETPEQLKARMAKRAETASKMADLKAHVLSVGPWRIYRLDVHNIVLEKQGGNEDARCYFPRFDAAVIALHRRLTEPTTKMDLQAYMDLHRKTEARLIEACKKFQEAPL